MFAKWMLAIGFVLAARVAMGGCAPEFTTQPEAGTLPIGSFVKLFGQVNSATPVTWSWQRGGMPLVDEGRFFGTRTQELTINRVEIGDAGTYTLVATNECGTATSVEVEIVVDCHVHWELKHPTAVRDVVYDGVRRRLVMAGSTGLYTNQKETWTWDGNRFRTLSAFGPSAEGLATCFDSSSGVIVGITRTTNETDPLATWEMHGDDWRFIPNGEIGFRTGYSIAYDEVRKRTVLFGGSNEAGRLNETWTWDGSAWSLVAASGPSPRYDHAMAFDRKRGVVVMHGGNTTTGYSDETWEWNGSSWSLVATGNPGPRVRHAMAFDGGRGTVVTVAGSSDMGDALETWEWNGQQWTNLGCDLPYYLQGVSMAFDEDRQLLVVNGPDILPLGVNARIWECDGTQWFERVGLPLGRYGGSVAYDAARQEVVRFGGTEVPQPQIGAETWVWNGEEWRLAATNGPASRSFAAMAFDPLSSNVVMFGGTGTGGPNSQTWLWDGISWTEANVPGPEARYDASMAFDPRSKTMILYGGTSSTVLDLTDTWSWDGQSWTKLDDNGPYVYSHGLSYDEARERMVLHGRDPASWGGSISQTYVWEDGHWTPVEEHGPDMSGRQMAFDADRGSVVAYGTGNQDPWYGVWELNGAIWLPRARIVGSALRGDLAFDSHRGISVFGAYMFSSAPLRTWEFRLAVEGDANADNLIDGRDLSVLLTQFGQSVSVGSGSA